MFTRILIANRGEIACRIGRAARSLGVETVAVFSEADADAMHVRLADTAVAIGPAPARESYLDGDRIIAAALAAGAQAVHPGYGFLAENSNFARRVAEAGLVWIGPAPETIAAMGDKEAARRLAREADVPVLPGSRRFSDDLTQLAAAAAEVGFPLLVKAAAGGGGIGMTRVNAPDQLEAIASRTIAQAARFFGDGAIYLERLVSPARHVEVQVFGDGAGRAVHMFDRDCSTQRRFQKIVEESPTVGLAPSVREKLLRAAVDLARLQHYAGPGTVEFLVDPVGGAFFFLEMNTRIQVEHTVSEMVTGLDLVAMQIRQAAGDLVLPAQGQVVTRGHAVECRLCAEDPDANFRPSPGRLSDFTLPPAETGLRLDTGYARGDVVSPYYDSLLAKIVAWGEDRAEALARLAAALDATRVEGVKTNLDFLRRITSHPTFVAGETEVTFVERLSEPRPG